MARKEKPIRLVLVVSDLPQDTIEVYPVGHPSATRGEIYDAYVLYLEQDDSKPSDEQAG